MSCEKHTPRLSLIHHLREQIARQGPEAYVSKRLPYVASALLADVVALTAPRVIDSRVAGVGESGAEEVTWVS